MEAGMETEMKMDDEINREIDELKKEFSKLQNELDILVQQATDKKTRMVEIQGAFKMLSKMGQIKKEKNNE